MNITNQDEFKFFAILNAIFVAFYLGAIITTSYVADMESIEKYLEFYQILAFAIVSINTTIELLGEEHCSYAYKSKYFWLFACKSIVMYVSIIIPAGAMIAAITSAIMLMYNVLIRKITN